MKLIKILLFTTTLFGFAFKGYGQNNYTFKVLGLSGSVKKNTPSGAVSLTPGSKLSADESIVIENGYCGLIHSTGKGVELKKSGTYSIAELSKSINTSGKQPKVSDRYVSYVMGQLTKDESEDINSNHRKYMEVTGSVERASTNYRIKLIALASNEIQPKSYTLNWNSNVADAEYVLDVFNLFNEVVFSARTKENSAAVDFAPLFAKHGKNLIVSVKVSGRPEIKSKEYTFKLADPSQTKELGLSEDKTPIGYMVNGIICEEHNMFVDALAFYREAANSEATVPEYKEAYQKLYAKLSGR